MLESNGLKKGESSFSNREFVQNLMQQNRKLEAALLKEEQADFEKS